MPVANDDVFAEPLREAVAPVKIRVGGYCRSLDLRRRGIVAWEKRKAPLLFTGQVGLVGSWIAAKEWAAAPIGFIASFKVLLT